MTCTFAPCVKISISVLSTVSENLLVERQHHQTSILGMDGCEQKCNLSGRIETWFLKARHNMAPGLGARAGDITRDAQMFGIMGIHVFERQRYLQEIIRL